MIQSTQYAKLNKLRHALAENVYLSLHWANLHLAINQAQFCLAFQDYSQTANKVCYKEKSF